MKPITLTIDWRDATFLASTLRWMADAIDEQLDAPKPLIQKQSALEVLQLELPMEPVERKDHRPKRNNPARQKGSRR